MNRQFAPWKWWESKRKKYNISLAIAGVVAFIFYAVIISVFEKYFNQAELTLFTTFLQASIYLLMMAIANICYFLGYLSERVISPVDVNKFRKITYNLGLYFSIILPLFIPLSQLFIVFKKVAL